MAIETASTKLLCVFCLALVVVSTGCGHVLYMDGPYYDKLLDRETKEPIEGAAVVAVWQKQSPWVGHYVVTYYDAQEAVTDQAGNFTIPGITGGSLNPLAEIRDPLFTIFKPDYVAYKSRRLPSVTQGGRAIVRLSPLTSKTREEKIRNLDLLLPRQCDSEVREDCVPQEKLHNLLKLKNVEENNLGLKPTYFPK
jgi:hypothetical protein